MLKINLIHLIIVFFTTACATNSVLTVNSIPSDAQVSIRALGGTEQHDLGKAPYRIKATELKDKIKSDNPIEITVKKDGYLPASVISTDYFNNNLNLELKMEVEPSVRDAKKVDQIISGLFECHRLVKAKKFHEAQGKIAKLIENFPNVSSIYEFQGSIYYVLNEKEKSFDSFSMAVKFNNENEEAKRMINILVQDMKK
jgi:hypothetical protein